MSRTEQVPPARRSLRVAGLGLWLSVGAAVVFVAWVAGVLGVLPPLPGRLKADVVTGYVASLADLVARLAALVTLGSLAGIIAFVAPRDDRTLSDAGVRLARWAGRAAQVWAAAALLQTVAEPAWVNGVPMGFALRPDGWWTFQVNTPASLAWLLTAVVAVTTVVLGYASRRYAAFVVAWVAGLLADAFVTVTGNVSVGLDHDWATDAAIAVTFAVVPLTSLAVGAVLAALADPNGAGATTAGVRRYHRAVVPALVVAALGHTLVHWQELAGVPLDRTFYGVPVAGFAVVFVLLAASWLWRQASGLARPDAEQGRALASVARDVVLFVAYLAFRSAANHIPPPRFLDPRNFNTQINYLGYTVDVPATLERLVSLGRPNILWVLLAVGSIVAYLGGVVVLHRRGQRWPITRTIPWVAGWGLTLFLATTGLWEYSTAVYSWHMFVHMTVNMLVPILCVLGGPFSLIEAASRPRAAGGLPTLADATVALGEYRPLQRLLSPPVLWINYVGSLFIVYYTPLFPWLMRYHWAHQLMLLYFMVTGYVFFNLIVGVDRQSWRLPHLVKLALMISVMPFHAIFAVGILMSQLLIGADFYKTIGVSWVGDLMADQNIAGQITWFMGEVPLFIAVIALSAQWFKADKSDAERIDATFDHSESDPLDAYNDMLAAMAKHDRASERARFLDDLEKRS